MSNKYYAQSVTLDGHRFASKREAKRYQDLKLCEFGGTIADLKLQVPFPLVVNGVKVSKWVADFVYKDVESGRTVHEDCKGYRTRDYIIRRKLVKALYGIDILET